MNPKYKKLLFDLDDTLVDDDYNRVYAIKKVLEERNEEASQEKVRKFIELDTKFWADRAAGKIKDPYKFKSNEEKTEWVRAQRFLKFFDDISFEEAVAINNKYVDYLKEDIMPIENAKEIMEYLFSKGYEIYIITNSPIKPVNNKLDKVNIRDYIKCVFSSEEAGFMKPHPEFFERFFKKTAIKSKDDMLIIGDELEKDVLGGAENGIDSCWFNRKCELNTSSLIPTYEIHNLIELKNIL